MSGYSGQPSLRLTFSWTKRYIGDQLKVELSKLFQLLRRQLDLKKDDFVDNFIMAFKGNPELLAEVRSRPFSPVFLVICINSGAF